MKQRVLTFRHQRQRRDKTKIADVFSTDEPNSKSTLKWSLIMQKGKNLVGVSL
jgi:hypothetical protein